MNAPRLAVLLALAGAAVAVAAFLLWPRHRALDPREASAVPERVEAASNSDGGELSAQEKTAQDSRRPVAPPAASSSSASRPSASRPKSVPKPIVLSGFVSDRAGKAISGLHAEVHVTDSRGTVRDAGIFAGFYSIDGCPDGTLDLGCEAVGFRPVTQRITLDPAEEQHKEDFVLEPGWTISVTILTTNGHRIGAPEVKHPGLLAEVLGVEARAPGEDQREGTFGRRAESEWLLGVSLPDSDGVLDVRLDPPIDVIVRWAGSIVSTTRVETRVDRVTLEIPTDALAPKTSELIGRVVDAASHEPLRDVSVTLIPDPRTKITTDEKGEFRVTNLRPGAVSLMIASSLHGDELRNAELLPGKVTDIGTVALDTSIELQGRFVDAEGHPADGELELNLCDDAHPLRSVQSPFSFVAQGHEGGRFQTGPLAHAKYVMRVRPSMRMGLDSPDWYAPPRIVDLTAGPIPDLVVTVYRGVEVILRPTTDAARDLGFCITAGDSIPERYGSFAGSGVVAERLGPGRYELVLGRGEDVVRRIPFTVGQDPLTIDVAP
jgi:hypothetical protein